MTTPRANSSRRSGFTLVELLTVIGIISLLIGILVPSLSRARDIAKKTKSLAEISAIEKSLEIIYAESKVYPESNSTRQDPINELNGVGGNPRLMGAHWLARAMVGPDTLGPDIAGHFVKDKDKVSTSGTQVVGVQSGGTGVTPDAMRLAERKGSFLEDPKVVMSDMDPRLTQLGAPGTGRLVIVDAFNYPILYYKANPRAKYPFCNTARGDQLGIYDQRDNIAITGGEGDPLASNWDFGGTGLKHGLGVLSPQGTLNVEVPPGSDYKGKRFDDYFHQHQAHETANVIKPYLPETFLLVSPGKDGIYGTDDDPNNFDR